MYVEHPRYENGKKRQKAAEKSRLETYKRRLEEIRAEEKSLHEELEQLKAEQTAASKAMEKTMGYIQEGGQKISSSLEANEMMGVQAKSKLIEFGRQQQSEANKKMS